MKNYPLTDEIIEKIESNGEAHVGSSGLNTPLRKDAFEIEDDEKMALISEKFADIMDILGLDLTDDSLSGTPHRVAKMFVKEIFYGLNPENKPRISVFDNKYQYDKFIIEKNVSIKSTCEHHFLPIVGHAHVGYISHGKVIGLSKINRIVDFCARRPQVQERLTRQILEALKEALDSEDVIVMIDASHFCVTTRGIQDDASTTITFDYAGKFKDPAIRKEFMDSIR